MDPIAGLLDGPRARRAFLLRCTLDPPWALHIRDEAPLSLVAMLRGRACFVLDGHEPEWLDQGDVAILLGPDHYLFADDPATAPQAIIHPDQRCTTPDGQEIPQMRSFGIRRWGNAPDGATEILTGTSTPRARSAVGCSTRCRRGWCCAAMNGRRRRSACSPPRCCATRSARTPSWTGCSTCC